VVAEQHFKGWFQQVTGYAPYPFQARFTCDETLPQLVHVPTGLGKTAMAVLGWLGRRRERDDFDSLHLRMRLEDNAEI
jgi:CRISPR-associated endonuclease/helicase Cas3